MLKIDYFLFGYRKILIKEEKRKDVLNICIKNNINLIFGKDVAIYLKLFEFEKFNENVPKEYFDSLSEVKGFPKIYKLIKCNLSVIFALLISIVLMMIFSEKVWDLRISGNENLSSKDIEKVLSDNGFAINGDWGKFNKSATQNKILENFKNISWVSVNRRGVVGYIKVIEKNNTTLPIEKNDGIFDVIASRDAVIEEISVESGTPLVKVGDIVKKGDILIKGDVKIGESTQIVGAKGKVVGNVSQKISVEVPRTELIPSLKLKGIFEINIKIFDFNLKIFKNSRNSGQKYVIIEDKEKVVAFDKFRLPIEFETKYAFVRQSERTSRSDDELIKASNERLKSSIIAMLKSSDVLKMKTSGSFTENGYCSACELVFSTEIGVERAYSKEDKESK